MSAIPTWNGPVTRHRIATPEELTEKEPAPYKPRSSKPIIEGRRRVSMGISLTEEQHGYLVGKGENISGYIRHLVDKDMASCTANR